MATKPRAEIRLTCGGTPRGQPDLRTLSAAAVTPGDPEQPERTRWSAAGMASRSPPHQWMRNVSGWSRPITAGLGRRRPCRAARRADNAGDSAPELMSSDGPSHVTPLPSRPARRSRGARRLSRWSAPNCDAWPALLRWDRAPADTALVHEAYLTARHAAGSQTRALRRSHRSMGRSIGGAGARRRQARRPPAGDAARRDAGHCAPAAGFPGSIALRNWRPTRARPPSSSSAFRRLTVDEAAEVVGISPATVKASDRRAPASPRNQRRTPGRSRVPRHRWEPKAGRCLRTTRQRGLPLPRSNGGRQVAPCRGVRSRPAPRGRVAAAAHDRAGTFDILAAAAADSSRGSRCVARGARSVRIVDAEMAAEAWASSTR
jgi:hypothetical protein